MNPSMQYSLRIKVMKGIYATMLMACSSLVSGQNALNILDLNHELFSNKNSLTVTTLARVGDYSFHTKVGGVSFQAVASPAKNLAKEPISLDFINNRLVIQMGKKSFYVDLPFWQLSPILNFVNSPYDIAYTQLGDTIGKRGAQCRFHPAFLNNLSGLRLFQADLLNLPNIMWDLPVNDKQEVILAPSEKAYAPQRDSILKQSILNKLMNAGFTSYILTDYNVKIVFDVDAYGPVFSGEPYYCFTKTRLDTSNFQSLRNQLFECYNTIETHAKILLKGQYTSKFDPRTNLGGLLDALNKNKQERGGNPYSMYYIETALNRLDSLNKLSDTDIGIQFQVLDEYTESFKSYWGLLKKYNPAVYSAVENISRWAAFFRYARTINPNNWSEFVKKATSNGKWDAPSVRTPTSFEINYLRYFEEKEKQ